MLLIAESAALRPFYGFIDSACLRVTHIRRVISLLDNILRILLESA